MIMKIFISGGCKNGKSSHAQKIAKDMQNGHPLYYLATMVPKDCEDEARILAHKKERKGWGFKTIEISGDLMGALNECDLSGTFLLDSTTALLESVMFRLDGSVDDKAHIRLTDDLLALAGKLCNFVIVSDYIYSDAVAYSELVEQYKKNLAYMDRRLAAVCDVVLEGCCGEVIVHADKSFSYGTGDVFNISYKEK